MALHRFQLHPTQQTGPGQFSPFFLQNFINLGHYILEAYIQFKKCARKNERKSTFSSQHFVTSKIAIDGKLIQKVCKSKNKRNLQISGPNFAKIFPAVPIGTAANLKINSFYKKMVFLKEKPPSNSILGGAKNLN